MKAPEVPPGGDSQVRRSNILAEEDVCFINPKGKSLLPGAHT